MVRIRFNDLDDAVKEFLARTSQGETIVVEDAQGRVQCGITPYVQASLQERETALAALGRIQAKAQESLDVHGATEGSIDSLLQD